MNFEFLIKMVSEKKSGKTTLRLIIAILCLVSAIIVCVVYSFKYASAFFIASFWIGLSFFVNNRPLNASEEFICQAEVFKDGICLVFRSLRNSYKISHKIVYRKVQVFNVAENGTVTIRYKIIDNDDQEQSLLFFSKSTDLWFWKEESLRCKNLM